jgi:hypothetical protein
MDTNTADNAAAADTTLEAAKATAFAAHKEYLEAHWAAFNAVLAVATGDQPTDSLYGLLAALDTAAAKHASACWREGAESARAAYR